MAKYRIDYSHSVYLGGPRGEDSSYRTETYNETFDISNEGNATDEEALRFATEFMSDLRRKSKGGSYSAHQLVRIDQEEKVTVLAYT